MRTDFDILKIMLQKRKKGFHPKSRRKRNEERIFGTQLEKFVMYEGVDRRHARYSAQGIPDMQATYHNQLTNTATRANSFVLAMARTP